MPWYLIVHARLRSIEPPVRAPDQSPSTSTDTAQPQQGSINSILPTSRETLAATSTNMTSSLDQDLATDLSDDYDDSAPSGTDEPRSPAEEPVQFGTNLNDVTHWVYKNDRMPAAPASIDQKSTQLQLTSYYLNEALRCPYKDSRKMILKHWGNQNVRILTCTNLFGCL